MSEYTEITVESEDNGGKIVLAEDGGAPIVLYEKEPTVRGVVVVAEGAADFSVREKLQAAVQAATGIPVSRIEVFEMSFGS